MPEALERVDATPARELFPRKDMNEKQSRRNPGAGKVFLMALQGVEILFLPGSNEIVTRIQSRVPAASSTAAVQARAGKTQRGARS